MRADSSILFSLHDTLWDTCLQHLKLGEEERVLNKIGSECFCYLFILYFKPGMGLALFPGLPYFHFYKFTVIHQPFPISLLSCVIVNANGRIQHTYMGWASLLSRDWAKQTWLLRFSTTSKEKIKQAEVIIYYFAETARTGHFFIHCKPSMTTDWKKDNLGSVQTTDMHSTWPNWWVASWTN